jgi:hypothetical protein
MNIHNGRKWPTRTVLSILVIAVLLDRYYIVPFFPWFFGGLGIDPAFVFLDIPAHLPFFIDLLPVLVLFYILYMLALNPLYKGISWEQCRQRTWSIITGLLVLIGCLVAGGILFRLVEDYLPREVRKGIDSLGFHINIYTPLPGYELIRLRGGMIQFLFLLPGLYFFMKRVRKEPVIHQRASYPETHSEISLQGPSVPAVVKNPAASRTSYPAEPARSQTASPNGALPRKGPFVLLPRATANEQPASQAAR